MARAYDGPTRLGFAGISKSLPSLKLWRAGQSGPPTFKVPYCCGIVKSFPVTFFGVGCERSKKKRLREMEDIERQEVSRRARGTGKGKRASSEF
jgi:hypothetical protein